MSFLIGLINKDVPPHTNKNYEIIVYTKGSGVFYTEGREIPLSPGKILIVPPGVIHSSTGSGPMERIYVNGEFDHVFGISSTTLISDNAENEGVLLAKMIYKHRFSGDEFVAALSNALAHYLMQSLKIESKIGQVIDALVNEITSNYYDSDINLSGLLQKTGYAEDYIRAQFKKYTRKTPTEFLTQIRINHACYLIDRYKNYLSLSEIAEKCGYTDYAYFSRKFKSLMGISPQIYKSV